MSTPMFGPSGLPMFGAGAQPLFCGTGACCASLEDCIEVTTFLEATELSVEIDGATWNLSCCIPYGGPVIVPFDAVISGPTIGGAAVRFSLSLGIFCGGVQGTWDIVIGCGPGVFTITANIVAVGLFDSWGQWQLPGPFLTLPISSLNRSTVYSLPMTYNPGALGCDITNSPSLKVQFLAA